MGTKEQSENADQSSNILKSILGVARRINKQDDCTKMIDIRHLLSGQTVCHMDHWTFCV